MKTLLKFPIAALPDTGKRTVSITGGLRETDDPVRGFFELIPPECEKRLAVHYARGAVKYAPRNWEKGVETGRTMRSLMRHVNAFRAGDRTEDHLSAIAWNAFCLMWHEERIADGRLPAALDTYPIVALKLIADASVRKEEGQHAANSGGKGRGERARVGGASRRNRARTSAKR